jgi:transketolase
MRNAFAEELVTLAEHDTRVVLLSGDIGNKLFDGFKEKFPTRFFNCGVAEANMMSVAAGMALSGLKPVVYTIAPFVTYRCFEQIRIDVCYHNVPVVIVGVGGGLSYASLGPTHHSCEELGCLRLLPNLVVASAADPFEVKSLLRSALKGNSPCYLRIGKKGEKNVHVSPPQIELGDCLCLAPGKDLVLLSSGTMLETTVHVAKELARRGISAEVTTFPTIKPLDQTYLSSAEDRFKLFVTVEEHTVLGGLGSAISEWLLRDGRKPRVRLLQFGTPDQFFEEAGETEYARECLGLSMDHIVDRVTKFWSSAQINSDKE